MMPSVLTLCSKHTLRHLECRAWRLRCTCGCSSARRQTGSMSATCSAGKEGERMVAIDRMCTGARRRLDDVAHV